MATNNGPGTPSPSRRRPVKKIRSDQGIGLSCLDATIVTPFGMGCGICKKSFGESLWSMQWHLNQHGVCVSATDNRLLVARKQSLEQILQEDPHTAKNFFTGRSVLGYSCRCLVGWTRLSNVMRHLSSPNSCGAIGPEREQLQVTSCGRLVSMTAVSMKYSQEDPILKTKRAVTQTFHMVSEEMVDCFVPLFHPLAQEEHYSSKPDGATFQERMENLLSLTTTTSKDEVNEPILKLFYDFGEKWLLHGAPIHVKMVPANFRSKLLVFDGTRESGSHAGANTTYTFTKFPNRLVPELKKLLCFIHKQQPSIMKRECDLQSLLVDLCLETPDSVRHHTMLMTYAVGRTLRHKDIAGSLSVLGPSRIATMYSALLTILRASICSLIYKMDKDYSQQALTLVKRAQESITINFLASSIRRMREKEALMPSSRKVSIRTTKDILVDNFLFKFDNWTNVVPCIEEKCISSFRTLLVGDQWTDFLNLNLHLYVNLVPSSGLVSLQVEKESSIITSEVIQVHHAFNAASVDILVSFLELAFHGTGLGSMRYAEIERCLFSSIRWHGQQCYYYSHTEKVYTALNNKPGKLVEHKLPKSLGRIFLVFRVVCQHLQSQLKHDLRRLVPVRNNRVHEMTDAVATIFGFENRPDCTLRRKCLSVGLRRL